MVTRGHRRLGRTIRKLEASVELSVKESKAKDSEKTYKNNIQKSLGYADDSPVQSLKSISASLRDEKASK